MTDLPVPQAEAKPGIVPMSVFRAARDWAQVHGHQSPDDRLVALIFAAGRAQAAADIRDHPGPDPSPASPAWWAGYSEALRDAALIAEGGGVAVQPKHDGDHR